MKNVEELTEKVYPDISNISAMPLNWSQERTILSPTNEQINDFMLSKFEASSQTYYSVNTVVDREKEVHYPTEFFNSLTPPGIPPHNLILKVVSPIILLNKFKFTKTVQWYKTQSSQFKKLFYRI